MMRWLFILCFLLFWTIVSCRSRAKRPSYDSPKPSSHLDPRSTVGPLHEYQFNLFVARICYRYWRSSNLMRIQKCETTNNHGNMVNMVEKSKIMIYQQWSNQFFSSTENDSLKITWPGITYTFLLYPRKDAFLFKFFLTEPNCMAFIIIYSYFPFPTVYILHVMIHNPSSPTSP